MKKSSRKIMCGILAAMCASQIGIVGFAAEKGVTVNLNGEEMKFETAPFIEDGRTLVPFRTIFEALDCAVSYRKIGDEQIVSAQRGTENIQLTIGKNSIFADGGEINLDVAPKVVNDRTFVPLRAVSESLDCEVEWLGDINTVCIYKKYGQYDITSGHIEKTIKNDDGIDLMYISAVYPIINDDNGFASEINKFYKEKAESFAAEAEKEYAEGANEILKEKGTDEYMPMDFCLSFEVNTNRKNLLSITTIDYRNTLGAHPNEVHESKTYDMTTAKEYALKDIMGVEQNEVDLSVTEAFEDWMKDNAIELDDEAKANIEKEAPNVQWYLTDTTLNMYFNQYQIAPYAAGLPMVEVPYKENEDLFSVDMSQAEEDKLEFEFDATVGYQWEVSDADADKIDVKEEKLQNGNYKFTVTGIGKGNASVEFVYTHKIGDKTVSQRNVGYYLYVNDDKKLTVLDSFDDSADEEKRTVAKCDDDIITLSDGEVYNAGSALVYDSSVKPLPYTYLDEGDLVNIASYKDTLVIIRNATAKYPEDEVEGFKPITYIDEDLIEVLNDGTYTVGEALIYNEESALSYKALKAGDTVTVVSGDADMLVFIAE